MYTCPLARVIRYSTAWLRYLPSRSPLSLCGEAPPSVSAQTQSFHQPSTTLFSPSGSGCSGTVRPRELLFSFFFFPFLAGIARATTRDFLVATSTNLDIPRNRSPAHSTADPACEQHHPPQPPHHTPVHNSQRRDGRGGDAVSSFGSSESLFFSFRCERMLDSCFPSLRLALDLKSTPSQ